IFRSVSLIASPSSGRGPRRVGGPAADPAGWPFVSLSGVWSQKVSQKPEQNTMKLGVRFGRCRRVSLGVARQNLTTNLGVGGSNPSGRANKVKDLSRNWSVHRSTGVTLRVTAELSGNV